MDYATFSENKKVHTKNSKRKPMSQPGKHYIFHENFLIVFFFLNSKKKHITNPHIITFLHTHTHTCLHIQEKYVTWKYVFLFFLMANNLLLHTRQQVDVIRWNSFTSHMKAFYLSFWRWCFSFFSIFFFFQQLLMMTIMTIMCMMRWLMML